MAQMTLSELLKNAKHAVVLTGAGISTLSGIPDFRGVGGLYHRKDIDAGKLFDIDYFRCDPGYYYKHSKDFLYNLDEKEPNIVHKALARLEEKGVIHAVITQNIDDLHRIAGNKVVHEFHGNSSRFVCKQCDAVYPLKEINITEEPALCPRCGHLLKPDFIFFGEGIPYDAYQNSIDAANDCDVFIIIGTSGQVSPANTIPGIAKRHGSTIIEINKDRSLYTDYITDIYLEGKSGEILVEIENLRI